MTIASGAYHGLIFEEETEWGDLNASEDMTELRHTSCSLVLNKDSFQSNELRSDRQISDLRHGVKRTSGDIAFELSYGEYDLLLEGALFGSWTDDVLSAGTTVNSYTIERQFADITQYGLFTGVMVNGMTIEIPANVMVTGTFNLVGKDATYSGATRDATANASQTESPFDSFTGTIEEGGVSIAIVTALTIKLENGVDPKFAVGTSSASDKIVGRSNVTGTVTAYFENLTLLNKFINETGSSIKVTLEDSSGNTQEHYLPNIKYTGANNPASGEGEITLTMPFQALLGSANAVAQVDTVTLSGVWATDDTITLTGVATGDVTYTVVAGDIVGAGNGEDTWSLIAAKLANAVNAAAGAHVEASNADEVVTLTAGVAGTGFTLGASASTTGTGDVADAQVTLNAAAVSTNYQITRAAA